MRDWESAAIVQELRQEQKQREMLARYTRPERQKALRLSYRVEARVLNKIRAMGYDVAETTKNAPFDAFVGGCRVEIKASNWGKLNRGGRYQANIRHCEADVLILVAINGQDHHFVIPMAEIGKRHNISVTSYNVMAYGGIWSPYLEAWDVLQQAVQVAPARIVQADLWGWVCL